VNDLDLLREWRVPDAPAPDVRDRALADLDALFYAPTAPVRGRPARRRLVLRAAIALTVTVALAAGVVVWAQRETNRRLDEIGRIHLPKGTLSGAPGGKLPATFLIVGSDSRAGINDPAFGDPSQQTGERADTMILLRVTKNGAAAMWIPRDIWADATSAQKLNGELVYGPASLIDAIRAKFGVAIDRYVEIRFTAFEKLVDAVGGVSLNVPYPARDMRSGLDVPVPGCTSFDGARALAWARSRSLQYYFDNAWKLVDPVPDVGRIARQEQLVRALGEKAHRALAGHPGVLLRVVDALAPRLQVDSGMGRSDIVRVARSLLGLDPTQLIVATLPWRTAPLRAGQAGLDAGSGAADLARRLAVAGEVGQLEHLLDQPVTGASTSCR
jgi:LCP family protein required for cell wall assembly